MAIKQNTENGILTISPEGFLNADTSLEVENIIESVDSFKALVIDMEQVNYISSAGIRVLLTALKKAKEIDADYSVINVNSEVKSVLSMTGLDSKLGIL